MTFNDRDTEAPMTTGIVMLIGAIAGALSAVAVAMLVRRRPIGRADEFDRPPFADDAEVGTFDRAGRGHSPPGRPPGGGHGGPRPGGGHGGGSAGGGHGGHGR